MVGSCHGNRKYGDPSEIPILYSSFLFGEQYRLKTADSLVDNAFLPGLSQLFGRECGTVSLFRYAVEDGAQKQIVISLSVRQFLDGMARAG